ncbi:putative membrane protein [Pseudorhizobium tarimense]|uniref:Membrane protein n=1 Tax=Pseudorhizobium tarimense TaxID=1079109 RepID=A0ABV2H4J8_9HYPH|nr:AzlD family protein [Pseudorhizobium tarimense]MCJ8518396.1 AzlD family protein [Pseudorhizobium tarimense]
MNGSLDTGTLLLILAAAVATYLTRIGGYVLITRMRSIPPRMEAALNAVPAAVLTTLVAPAFFEGGWDVKIAMLVALAAALRFPGLIMLAAGWAAVVICRHLLGL